MAQIFAGPCLGISAVDETAVSLDHHDKELVSHRGGLVGEVKQIAAKTKTAAAKAEEAKRAVTAAIVKQENLHVAFQGAGPKTARGTRGKAIASLKAKGLPGLDSDGGNYECPDKKCKNGGTLQVHRWHRTFVSYLLSDPGLTPAVLQVRLQPFYF